MINFWLKYLGHKRARVTRVIEKIDFHSPFICPFRINVGHVGFPWGRSLPRSVEISSLVEKRRIRTKYVGKCGRGSEREEEKDRVPNPRDRAGNAIKAAPFRSLNRFPWIRRNVARGVDGFSLLPFFFLPLPIPDRPTKVPSPHHVRPPFVSYQLLSYLLALVVIYVTE